MEPIAEKIKNLDGGRILDVATSHGDFLRVLAKSFKSYGEAIGIDVAEDRIEAARNHADDDLTYEVMSATDIAFDSDSFDTVSMRHSLHHLRDIDKSLSEAVRVLKPGGLFILGEVLYVPEQEKENSWAHFHRWLAKADQARGQDHFETLPRERVMAHVEKLGLSTIIETFDHLTVYDAEEQVEVVGHIKQRIEPIIAELEKIGGLDEHIAEGRKIIARYEKLGITNEPELYVLARK